MNEKLTLNEIASWQLNSETSEVELPSVQRGFVWKPQQVENLWDSILRDFPIGSFLFSEVGYKYYLMDGQQRATSIFLGYFNPFDSLSLIKAWSIKGELPVVWIDIRPKEKPDTSKYLIRLITRSHPWGYQARNNNLVLTVGDRRKALELFKKNPDNTNCGYTSFRNTSVFPYDASFPLPLSFFIESENVEQVLEKVKAYLPDYLRTKHGGFEGKDDFFKILKTELSGEIEDILDSAKKLKARTINYDVVSNDVLKEEEDVENPTLFVRINSSGTTLSGDDLIYSIYKATFPETKDLVEKAGMNFIAPTQVISLASRIAWAELNENTYPQKMNVRDFQRRIKDKNFKNKLQELIETNAIGELFSRAINILCCKNNPLFCGEIPPIIIKQLINKSQELFLFFVYWLHLHKDNPNNERQLLMAAKLLVFSWFEFVNIPRLWEEYIQEKDFWEESLNKFIWWDGKDGIHFLIPPELLRNYYQQPQIETLFLENDEHKWELREEGIDSSIVEYFNKVKSDKFELEKANEYFWKPIRILQQKKQMILFAQREYINSVFGDYNQMDDLEDTNVPWDWDHIYPNSWVYHKLYCEPIIKDWNNTNGNFRAISLEQNRSESNALSPKERLSSSEEQKYFFIQNDWAHWQLIDERIWDKDKAIEHFRAITTRMINIYEKFWNDFRISELIALDK
ncbi:hypothetical protein EZS27_014832 [termite gut metagenome]|uniref:GmrSD restriction endonucleases N-terminal domain-containing protein n=1 Tax=termite gut metagenome TaxID=433724 RepID=A0A5J4RTV7_9ZZZZ